VAIRWSAVRSIAALGEPLIELRPAGGGELEVGFGGDVANVLVCLARMTESARFRLRLVTALGQGGYADWLRERLRAEGIELVEGARGGNPGIYGISPAPAVYPKSSYWRGQSAAAEFFRATCVQQLRELVEPPDLLLLTGITLAICSPASFEALAGWLETLVDRCVVVLDCNYREVLWTDRQTAQYRIGRIERMAAVVMTGLEDERLLWAADDVSAILARLGKPGRETVVRAGDLGCWIGTGTRVERVPALSVSCIDATGAGDSHAAAYIAARAAGLSEREAADFGNQVAAAIVSQGGAIPRRDSILPRPRSRPVQ
jgi:2-dehydro-3-deoxygluconokinase